MQVKKIPQRKCLGCGLMKEKRDLIRVVRSPEGEISLDVTGKKSGRGAYICHDLACLKKARKAGRIGAQLKVTIPETIYDAMEAELSDGGT